MADPVKHEIDWAGKFPRLWKDRIGVLRIVGKPAEGYVMVRRTGATPFVLALKELSNHERHPIHGPFMPAVKGQDR